MPELLEIGFERLSPPTLAELVEALGLPIGFARDASSFAQMNRPVLLLPGVELQDASIGVYPYDGARDLEISIDHPGSEPQLLSICSATRSLAEKLRIPQWGVGLFPVDDPKTLYFSNEGPGPLF